MFSINLKIPLSGGKNACGSYIVASYYESPICSFEKIMFMVATKGYNVLFHSRIFANK